MDNLYSKFQKNQNANIDSNFGYSTNDNSLNTLFSNYMYDTIINKKSIRRDSQIFKELMGRTYSNGPTRTSRLVSHNAIKLQDVFNYHVDDMIKLHNRIYAETNCRWLDHRLSLYGHINDLNSLTQTEAETYTRNIFVYVAIGLMTFYHTQSKFVLQILRIDSVNLLILLKHNLLVNFVKDLPDGFSKSILKIVSNPDILLDGKKMSLEIPELTEQLIGNYALLPFRPFALREKVNTKPRLTYLSFSIPLINNDLIINKIYTKVFDKRILGLQRKYMCKFVVHHPIDINARSSRIQGFQARDDCCANINNEEQCCVNKQSECCGILKNPQQQQNSIQTNQQSISIEVFFDYRCAHWSIVLSELTDWLTGASIMYGRSATISQRSQTSCNVDYICITSLRPNFFCCDEIKNLLRRQHTLREADPYFTELIQWVRKFQLDFGSF